MAGRRLVDAFEQNLCTLPGYTTLFDYIVQKSQTWLSESITKGCYPPRQLQHKMYACRKT